MGFFQIEFEDGKSYEYQAHTEDLARHWGEQRMHRWNQPTAMIFRTAPDRPDFRKPLAFLENFDFNSESPILIHDPHYGYKEKAKKTKKVREPKEGAKESKPSEPRVTHTVPLKDLADKLETPAGAIRRRLRSSKIEKPVGGWGWDSWEDVQVKLIESWYMVGPDPTTKIAEDLVAKLVEREEKK